MYTLLVYYMIAKATLILGTVIVYVSSPNDGSESSVVSSRPCPCSEGIYCERIQQEYEKEVFLFSVTSHNWKKYDWSRVTTIVQFGYHDDQLLCYAHSQGARVLFNVKMELGDLTNATARRLWVEKQITYTSDNFLDGVNVDFESAIHKESVDVRNGFTQYMTDLVTQMKQRLPGTIVTIDYAWSGEGIDDRFYDYKAIGDIIDMAFVMSYDERSQIRGDCVAWANSGFNNTLHGIHTYMQQGIPGSKLILGLPWYGYRYPCQNYDITNQRCAIKPVPFHGVNCSDAAGSEVDYSKIVKSYLPQSFTGRLWDETAQSPYFSMKDADTGKVIQVWYDDPDSLAIKYQLVNNLGLRGLGMWTADSLDYNDPEMITSMWGAIPYIKSVK